MTTPPTGEPSPELPSVDSVIQDAREGSWHLPETPPSELKDAAADAAPPAPTRGSPAAHQAPAPAAASRPASSGPATSAEHAVAPPHGATAAHGAASQSAAAGAASGSHDAPTTHGTPAAHGAAAGHGGGHGEDAAEPLGPVDVEMWGAGIAATIVGLFMAICFVLATSGAGAY